MRTCQTLSWAPILAIVVLLSVWTNPAHAQFRTDPQPAQLRQEPLYDQLIRTLKRPYFTVTVLGQAIADVPFSREAGPGPGLEIGTARVALSGDLDQGFSYLVQGDFAGQPALLDGRLTWHMLENAWLHAGVFKTPFSHEFLTYAGDLDFIGRSQAVNLLATRRQVGVSFDGGSRDGNFLVSAGMFNGNGIAPAGNDNNRFMYVGRVSAQPQIGATAGERLVVGVNAAYDDIRGASITDQVTVGGDLRLTAGPFLLASEAIQRSTRRPGADRRTDIGFHGTAGLFVTPRHQLLARWDSFLPDDPAGDSTFIILGSNYWPITPVKLQFNYFIPPDEPAFENHRVMMNFQILI